MELTQILGASLLVFSLWWLIITIKNAKLKGWGCYSFSRDIGGAICGILLGLALLFDKVEF